MSYAVSWMSRRRVKSEQAKDAAPAKTAPFLFLLIVLLGFFQACSLGDTRPRPLVEEQKSERPDPKIPAAERNKLLENPAEYPSEGFDSVYAALDSTRDRPLDAKSAVVPRGAKGILKGYVLIDDPNPKAGMERKASDNPYEVAYDFGKAIAKDRKKCSMNSKIRSKQPATGTTTDQTSQAQAEQNAVRQKTKASSARASVGQPEKTAQIKPDRNDEVASQPQPARAMLKRPDTDAKPLEASEALAHQRSQRDMVLLFGLLVGVTAILLALRLSR
jgi:hypothetical protein